MTPKEKAKELVDKYSIIRFNINGNFITRHLWKEEATQYALIAVDEILNQQKKIIVSHIITAYKSAKDFNKNLTDIQNQLDHYVLSNDNYWRQVKQEIQAL